MKKITIGIVAHVDAGKTTLSEAILYTTGKIRSLGRVDNKDAFLDNYSIERERGITIFSKQAEFKVGNTEITLLDTPGHVDFSAEMERTLQVLDYAILVISGADGVQGHTRTLWKLLEQYNIPTFIFVNKMDQIGVDKEAIFESLKQKLSGNIIDFSNEDDLNENIASCDEELMERYFEDGEIKEQDILRTVATRKIFPCYCGTALKLQGVDELLGAIDKYTLEKKYPKDFGAIVYKITRDDQNNRLTHVKILGGSLKVKEMINDEKVNQIRIYSGNKYETVDEVSGGTICALTGPVNTRAGMGIGLAESETIPVIEPVLNYKIVVPAECNISDALDKLRLLEEEEPELQIEWNSELKEIHAKLMGEIQIEILKRVIKERFNIDIEFGAGNIVYKETIADVVEGVGHFEPLRHYAEVHLLMEPLPQGSGIVVDVECSEDKLDKNWQRLIVTHIYEKEHRGVLVGAPITDMRITLVAGAAHLKHTEGGDFRQATYRAIRQGLCEATSVLLEPYYDFTLDIPADMVGRAMSDIDRMKGKFDAPMIFGDAATITGSCPVSTMRDYHMDVISYTGGMGRLFCNFKGYDVCHNAEEVIENTSYNPEADLENPTGSVFCAHGAGFNVPWNEVKNYMHIESIFDSMNRTEESEDEQIAFAMAQASKRYASSVKEERELEEIFARTYGGISDSHNIFHTNASSQMLKNKKTIQKKTVTAKSNKPYVYKPVKRARRYVIVDGYNVVFAWKDLKELANNNIDSAKDKLVDILCNYQGIIECDLIVVFDAYKVKDHASEELTYNNITIVYTKENQTADTYIEQFAHKMGRKYDVTVVTSDGLEQITALAQGCKIMSASELKTDIEWHNKQIADRSALQKKEKEYLLDNIGEDVKKYVEVLKKDAKM